MGLQWAMMSCVRATMSLKWVTMDRRSSASVCAHVHLYAHAIHFFLSTVYLGLTCQLYISYPISTNKLKKNLIKKFFTRKYRLRGPMDMDVHLSAS